MTLDTWKSKKKKNVQIKSNKRSAEVALSVFLQGQVYRVCDVNSGVPADKIEGNDFRHKRFNFQFKYICVFKVVISHIVFESVVSVIRGVWDQTIFVFAGHKFKVFPRS